MALPLIIMAWFVMFSACFFACYRMSCNTNVIHVDLSCVRDAQRVRVHLMPCEIEHSGPAQVSQYFNAATKECEQGTHAHIQIIFMQAVLKSKSRLNFCHSREDCVI